MEGSTEQIPSPNTTDTSFQAMTPSDLPVLGYPGPTFWVIHSLAIGSLVISIVVSGVVLLYLRPWKGFYHRPIGERLVVYLAVCDLCYSISHVLDHAYMMAVKGHPPDQLCITFALILFQFFSGQSILVIFTALNAFCMIVLQKRIPTGKWDRGLIVLQVFPLAVGIPLAATKYLGPHGAWCFIDMRRPYADFINYVFAGMMLAIFLFNVVCYLSVWFKIRSVARKCPPGGGGGGKRKYHGTARVMLCFVLAYIGQWWPFVTYALWTMVGTPHSVVYCLIVIFCNMGGVLNFLAYTYVRRRYAATGICDGGN